MIPVIGTAVLNRGDLLLRLARSIDFPVAELRIVDNSCGNDSGVTAAIEEIVDGVNPDKVRQVSVLRAGYNLGCAGSWNALILNQPLNAAHDSHAWITALPKSAPDWYLICGNDIAFGPGDLERVWGYVTTESTEGAALTSRGRGTGRGEVERHKTTGMFFGNHGHSAFVITRLAIERAGWFDENIYPGYLEDCDHSRRCHVAGVKQENIPGCRMIHGEPPEGVDPLTGAYGSNTINSDPVLSVQNGRTHGNNFKYYRAKWGGNNGEEKFERPFNQPDWDARRWELDLEFRREQSIWTPSKR